MKPLRIRIVGGSLAGLFAAILLGRDGHDVKIYERSSSGFAGRGAGLVPQQEVFHMLREIGVEHLASFGVVAEDRIYLDRSGEVARRMHMPQMQISWDVLYASAAERLEAGRYVLGRKVREVHEAQDVSVLHFSDGSTEEADLVIGADGVGSVVRGAINRITASSYAGYVAWRGLIPERLLPPAASLLSGTFSFYVARGNHALGYLVPGSAGEIAKGARRYNWVWYRFIDPADLAAAFTGTSGETYRFSLPRGEVPEERRSLLVADAERFLPPQFAAAIAAERTPSAQGIFDYEAENMVGRTTALIGDAAFVVRPHTAMGVSKAAGDVLSMRDHLRRGNDLAEALRLYQADRIAVGREIAAYGRQLAASSL